MKIINNNYKIKFISKEPALGFNDVSLIPCRSKVYSHKDVSILQSYTFKTKNTYNWEGVPIVSSNNHMVSNLETFNVLRKKKYMTCFPKHFNMKWYESKVMPEELLYVDYYILSCGIEEQDYLSVFNLIDRLKNEQNTHVKFLCVDISNGYLNRLLDVCYIIKNYYPDIVLIAGNVVTPDIVYDLIKNYGVDIVKCGLNSNNNVYYDITNRTGVGYPQFSAILDCAQAAREAGGMIMSDGDITTSGDIVKSFGAGSHFVMCDSMFTAHEESPGTLFVDPDTRERYKMYRIATNKILKRYNKGVLETRLLDDEKIKINIKGNLIDTIENINDSIKQGCSYMNAFNLTELYENSEFVRIINNGISRNTS